MWNICKRTYLVQHVIDQLNFIGDFGAAKDGEERPFRVLQCFGKVFQLLLHEEARCALGQLHADHTRVGAMRSSEGIVDVDIAELCEFLSELLDLGRIGFGLGTVLVLDRPFLLDVEAQVLEQDDRARRSSIDSLLNGAQFVRVYEKDLLS